MSLQKRYLWRVYVIGPPSRYETIISETEPTVGPGGEPIRTDETIILESLFVDLVTDGYINIESTLADNQAVRISASNVNGGVDINAGFGGITIDSTNTISLDANAASNFTTSNGNLTLNSTNALTNIDGGTGINIATTSPVINIGNQISTSQTNIQAGNGGFNVDVGDGGTISLDATGSVCNWTVNTNANNQDLVLALLNATDSSIILESQGIGSDAIRLSTAGGIVANANDTINIISNNNVGGAITLDTSINNGGITLSAGSQGIAINSTGLVGIGHWYGGDIVLGTASVSRNIIIGNSTGSTLVALESGTGGIFIGNNSTTGPIEIGNSTTARTIRLGNSTANTRLFLRHGTSGLVKQQPVPVSLADANATLTINNLLTSLLVINTSSNRTLTLPTANDVVSGISSIQINDSIDFSIVNTSSTGTVSVTAGSNGSIQGTSTVYAAINNSGSGLFRLVVTNVSTPTYIVYRIA